MYNMLSKLLLYYKPRHTANCHKQCSLIIEICCSKQQVCTSQLKCVKYVQMVSKRSHCVLDISRMNTTNK